jgi:hypothetical protein
MKNLNWPTLAFSVLALTSLLVALWRDDTASVPQYATLLPVIVANAAMLLKWVRFCLYEQPPEDSDDKAIAACVTFFLVLWNITFTLLAFLDGSIMSALAPLLVAWAAEGLTLTTMIFKDGGAFAACLHCCCFWAPWLVQILLIGLKLDGSLDSTWAVVLTPIWILDLMLLVGLLGATVVILGDSDERENAQKVANLFAAWATFIPIGAAELLLADVGEASTRLRIVSPILVGWGALLLVRGFGAFVEQAFACKDRVDGVRARLRDRQQQEETRAGRRTTAVATAEEGEGGGKGKEGGGSRGGRCVSADMVVVEIAAFGGGEDADGMPALPPSPVGVPGEVERVCVRCANNKDTATVRRALEDLLALLEKHPQWHTEVVRKRVVSVGKAQAGKPAWDQSVQAAMGKVLRLLHPISALRHRLAFFVGNAGQSLRTKVSGRS